MHSFGGVAGLAKLKQIRPVHYRDNELFGDSTDTEHIGVIAQELQPIAPYMVSSYEKEGEEYLKVDNSAMVYMLINAVQELSGENDALETKISHYETALHEMQSEMTKIKTQLATLTHSTASNDTSAVQEK